MRRVALRPLFGRDAQLNGIVTIGWSRQQATLAVDTQRHREQRYLLAKILTIDEVSAEAHDQVLIKEIFYEQVGA